MKLGICVVYLVSEGNERLLDIHLDMLSRHTGVGHTLHAAADRLSPHLRDRLLRYPGVRLLEPAPTELRAEWEHSHYLERLVADAVAEGASHVCVLHVDSFPLRAGWAEELACALSPDCPLVAAVRDERADNKPFTAFMLFTSEMWRRLRPTFLLPENVRAGREYRRYRNRFPHHPDSGVGYGFALFGAGLRWKALPRTNRSEDHGHFGSVYGDSIFHLGAAAWSRKDFPGSRDGSALLSLRRWLGPRLARVLPAPAKAAIRTTGIWSASTAARDEKYERHEKAFQAVRRQLFADPEGYLASLRTGARPPAATPET